MGASWVVEVWEHDELTFRNDWGNNGTEALWMARRLHRDPNVEGDIYVWTPKQECWLTEPNGYRQIGF